MTKEEKKEYKKRKKELMKFGRTAKLLYFVFILILLAASAYFVKLTWDECKAYQAASAQTRINEAIEELKEKTGLETKTNMIPVKTEDNDITYRLYSDGEAVADVELHKNRSCCIVLAIYDEPVIKSLMSYDLLVPVDSVIEITEEDKVLDATTLVSDIEETALNKFSIPAKATLNEMGISVPKYKNIKVSGIFDISQVKIKAGETELKLYEMKDGRYFAASVANDDLNSALRKRAAYIAEKYANYISNDYPYASLRSMICWNAPFADRLLNVTLTWYGAHDKVETTNMKVSDAVRMSDNNYMLNVSFDYITTGIYGVNNEESKLNIYLHWDSDDVWRISELMNNIQMDWIEPYEFQ